VEIRNKVKRDPLRYVKSNGEDNIQMLPRKKEKIEGGVGEEEKKHDFHKGKFSQHICAEQGAFQDLRYPLSVTKGELKRRGRQDEMGFLDDESWKKEG